MAGTTAQPFPDQSDSYDSTPRHDAVCLALRQRRLRPLRRHQRWVCSILYWQNGALRSASSQLLYTSVQFACVVVKFIACEEETTSRPPVHCLHWRLAAMLRSVGSGQRLA